MDFLKDRRTVLIFGGGAALAVLAGLGIAVALMSGHKQTEAPPASRGGLIVETGRDDDSKLDPARPLRCFVGGTFVGEITLADSATRRLHVKTISGALTADLDNPPRDSDIFLETVSGEITIRVREDSDLAVHLSATSGRVTSGFPALAVAGRWPSSVRGMIGAGTGRLHANATSGNISLLCRPVDDEFAEGASQSGEPAE